MAAAAHRVGSPHLSPEVHKHSDFRELAGFVMGCAGTCVRRESWHKPTLSFPAYFIGGNSDSTAECRGAFRLRSTSDPNKNKWPVW